MPKQNRLIDHAAEFGLKIGDRVRVLGKRTDASVKGTLLEVDATHLIVAPRPGYEEIFLCSDVAAVRKVRHASTD